MDQWQLVFDSIAQRQLDGGGRAAQPCGRVIHEGDSTQRGLFAAGIDGQPHQLPVQRSRFGIHRGTLKDQAVDFARIAESEFCDDLAAERISHQMRFCDGQRIEPLG